MTPNTDRRSLLAAAGLWSAARFGRAAEKRIRVKTFTYKRVGKLAVKADVHRADDRDVRPVVVWIHGGALIMGNRSGINSRVKQMVLDAGYALVSIDYRLAPETKLPAIIEDLEDAFAWVAAEGPRLFGVDTRKIAASGGSAGGYLTLTAGFRAKPRPAVLIPLWGYGDLVGEWYSKPSPHRRHQTDLSRAEALRQVSGPPISEAGDRRGDGGAYYRYCRLHGIWPEQVSTWDPHREAEKFFPFMPLKHVTADYPPTLMIHGTADTDVPHRQSVLMAEQFSKHGVAHKLVSVVGAEHGLAGGDAKQIAAGYEAALTFLNRYMLTG